MQIGMGMRFSKGFLIWASQGGGDPNAAWVTASRIVASFSFAQPGTLPFRVATHAQAATTHVEIDTSRRLVVTIGGVAHVGACPLWRAGETISGSLVLSVEAGNGTPWVRVRRGSDVDDVVDPYLGALPTMGAVAAATTGPTLGAGVTLALGASAWSAAWLLVQRFGLLDAGAFASSPGFTCASGSRTVQTSASTIATGIGVDVDAIGSFDGVTFGAQHEERTTNAFANPRRPDLWTAGVDAVLTGGQADAAGGTGAYRHQVTSASGYSSSQSFTGQSRRTWSAWFRRGPGSGQANASSNDAVVAGVVLAATVASDVWQRNSVTASVGSGASGGWFPVLAVGLDRSASGGLTAGTRDVLADFPQLETRESATSFIDGTRLGTRRSFAASRIVASGRLRGRTTLAVGPHASATLTAPVAIVSGPNLTITYTRTTGFVAVTIDGVTQTSGTVASWAANSVVSWAWDVGGRAPEVWIRVGTTTTKLLGGGAVQNAVSGTGTIDILGNAANVDATDTVSARQQNGLISHVVCGLLPAWAV